MKRHPLLVGALLGGFTALVLAAFAELASHFLGLPGIAFSLFDWMARHLPGAVISLFIDTMVRVISTLDLGPTALIAKRMEQATAILMMIGVGVVFGLVLTAVSRRRPASLASNGLRGGLLLFIPLFLIIISLSAPSAGYLISTLWLALLFMGWGWVLGRLVELLVWPPEPPMQDPSRREFLYLVGAGSFAVLVSALGVSVLSRGQGVPTTGGENGPEGLANASTTSGSAASPPRSALAARFPPVPGTRPELTPTADFYRIDINTIPPSLDASQWKLEIKGLVDKPLHLTLDDILKRPAISQAVTLECISNPVGGDLTSTGLWTGTRLKEVLADAGIQSSAQEVFITSADGFYESVTMSDVMDDRTLLVYSMNGQALTVEHGFPLRLYIPNRFGMKQPKWIVSMEVIDHHESGYWEDRGWDNQAIPPTTSVIDTVEADAYDPKSGLVPVGGIAYAGARGISKVEVQVDNGPWALAELRTPPLSPLTWVQWRYLWKSELGEHTFRVRAYDGAGRLQTAQPAPPEPSGATGIYSKQAFLSQGSNNSRP